MNSIVTRRLKAGYGGAIVVPGFDVEIPRGKITSIIGANGCGKSTVLKAIGRILPAMGGTVIVNDVDIQTRKSREVAQWLAILPQTPTAPGALTCEELVAYGRYPYQKGMGRLTKEDREAISWALEATGMLEFRQREIACLSGGQRQRAWVAMALAQQTGIVLLDEPTTHLDLCHQLEVLEILRRLNREQGTTVVMVLHDLNLASRYSDRLLAMKDGQIAHYGTPEEVMTREMLAGCFGIDGDVVSDPRSGKPVCLSYALLQEKR